MASKEMLNSDYFVLGMGTLRLIFTETRDEHKDCVKWGQDWVFLATACVEVVVLVSKLFDSGLDPFHLLFQVYFLFFFQPAFVPAG